MRIAPTVFYTIFALILSNFTEVSHAEITYSSSVLSTNNVVVPASNDGPKTGSISSPSILSVKTPKAKTPNLPNLAIRATDVKIIGGNEELQQIVRQVIATRGGSDTSENQLQQDVTAILSTGLFTDAKVNYQENTVGWNVVYEVQPVVVRSLQLTNAQILTIPIANDILKYQLGTTISPKVIQQAVQKINQWYKQNGYELGQVLAISPNANGILNIQVAEGVVGNIKIRFVKGDGQILDDKNQPIQGRTQEEFIRRNIKLQPGQILTRKAAQADLKSLYQLGLFDNVNISLDGDANKVDVTYNIIEKSARGVNAGAGYSESSGIVGTVSYNDVNVGGTGKQVGLNVQGGARDIQFNGKFTNPYRASEPEKLGYSINGFRNQELSPTFDDKILLPNGDRVRESELGGGVTVNKNVGDWQAAVGVNYKRINMLDREGNITPKDAQGNSLSFSGTGTDDLTTVSVGLTRDRRDNPINPNSGSVISLSSQQSIPIGQGNILMNRVQANYSQYIPVQILGKKESEVLAVNLQGGTAIGDLPPSESFNIGGPNSVRGYAPGAVASGRSYVLASAEYRFPIWQSVGGVVFADFGSDLGTAATVPGEPGVVRGKPGTGLGYGAGVRVQSPIGIIRADYGRNDQGENRVQFGVGQRF